MEQMIIIISCSFLAMMGVMLIGLPVLSAQDRKKRLEGVMTFRQDLVETERKRINEKKDDQENINKGLSDLMRLQKWGGQKAIRENLAKAGMRSPRAAVIYIVARIILPLVTTGACLFFLSLKAGGVSDSVTLLSSFGAAFLGFKMPALYVKNARLKRQEEITEHFPDALDLLLICVQGGLSMEGAITRVTREIGRSSPILGEEFALLAAELSILGDRMQALRNFSNRIGTQSVSSLVNTLIQAERYGTSLSGALKVLSADMREKRMANAERIAAALPPKLTVPMIVFFMPTLFIVILGPAAIQATETMANM